MQFYFSGDLIPARLYWLIATGRLCFRGSSKAEALTTLPLITRR